MFGNNITGPFISPTMPYGPMINNASLINTTGIGMHSAPMMGIANSPMLRTAPRTGGFLSSLLGRGGTESILSGAKSTLNFGNILTNTSKALGVVKEAIPIVKEVGPMMGNMKSMLKIASIFKDETDTSTRTSVNTSSNEITTRTNEDTPKENDTRITSTNTNQTLNNEPNFFL